MARVLGTHDHVPCTRTSQFQKYHGYVPTYPVPVLHNFRSTDPLEHGANPVNSSGE